MILVHVAALGLPLVGCRTASKSKAAQPLTEEQKRTDDDLLWNATRDVFSSRSLDVALEDAERKLITSQWTEVNKEVRHRYVARVIRADVGLVVHVTSSYERRETSGDHTRWVTAEDPYTARQVHRDEQQMVREIVDRFTALGGKPRR